MLLNIFCSAATYNGAILNQLSNPSWNISKDGIVITQGTLGMEKLWESYGKATNHTRERDLANMEELSVWESYGKAMGNFKISYFYARFSIHRWKIAMRNPRSLFFCYEKPLQGSFPPWFLGHDNIATRSLQWDRVMETIRTTAMAIRIIRIHELSYWCNEI